MDKAQANQVGEHASDGIDKYRELYVMSKEILAEEHARFGRLDQKASNYLAALTLAFTIFGLVAASFLDKLAAQRSFLDWALVALTVLIPVLFLLSWLKVFAVLKVQGVRRPPEGVPILVEIQ